MTSHIVVTLKPGTDLLEARKRWHLGVIDGLPCSGGCDWADCPVKNGLEQTA